MNIYKTVSKVAFVSLAIITMLGVSVSPVVYAASSFPVMTAGPDSSCTNNTNGNNIPIYTGTGTTCVSQNTYTTMQSAAEAGGTWVNVLDSIF